MENIIAIVGRPNVGKSTLFNRLTESRDAIVDETSGVTRDRHYGTSVWNGKEFYVIDTGGYITNSDDVFEEEIRKQVKFAIDEANIILFVTDVTTGITDLDLTINDMLRKTNKKYFLVVNKADNNTLRLDANEFFSLGVSELYPISSINGSGTGDLLDAVVNELPENKPIEQSDNIPKYAVIGRPNVGKSSLINFLIGEERNIVTPVAGTTRDAVLTYYNKFGHQFYIIDTAGIRKKTKVEEDLEYYSVLRSIRAIEKSDVCLLLIDAVNGIESQDLSIFKLVINKRKGVVIVVNKWDLIDKNTQTSIEYEQIIRDKLAPFNDVPIIFTSVLEKQRIQKVLDVANKVYKNRTRKIKTSELNEIMLDAIEKYSPPSVKGKFIKIKYVSQLPTHAPSFAFYCNLPQYIKTPYKRYLENQLRKNFDFHGVPIQIFFRKK
ncbi:MAG: ribosome biogenesis GTPase Der [Marinilabiliales bacterium]